METGYVGKWTNEIEDECDEMDRKNYRSFEKTDYPIEEKSSGKKFITNSIIAAAYIGLSYYIFKKLK